VEGEAPPTPSRPARPRAHGLGGPPAQANNEFGMKNMTSFIAIEKVWSDEDVVEFELTTADGRSSFFVKVYTGHKQVKSNVADHERLKEQLYGGN
jgi:hypothetical protein